MTIKDRVITGNYGEDSVRTFECDCCGEEETGHPYYGELGEQEENPLCETCYYQDTAEPAAIVIDCPGDDDRFKLRVGSYRIEWDDGEWVDPNDPDPVIQLAKSIRWVSTDPWRGYYDFGDLDGFYRAIDTWFCGFDGTNVDGDLALFHQRWDVDKDNPPFQIVVAFPRGSNVMTSIITVWVPLDREEEWRAWLES